MAPAPFIYETGQKVTITVEVVDGRDVGNPIISIGATTVPITRAALDRADVRGDSQRPPTPEEVDLKRIKEAQDAKAVARAAQEAAVEQAEVAAGEKMVADALTVAKAPPTE